jgi:RNA polymerase sigma factor (sigma-70 family)
VAPALPEGTPSGRRRLPGNPREGHSRIRGMEPVAASAARIGGVSLLRLQSDEALAWLAARGSDEAFETLVHRYRKSLLRSCRRLLSADSAEDAVQQALLDAHQALARNGSPERFRPWLHRIAVNAALKIALENGDVAPMPVDDERTNGAEGPDVAHERRERLHRTVGAIHALPRRQRRALVLRELEGRSHDEIADELGLTGGAVRQLIHRARNSVRSAASALIPPAFLLRLLGAGGSAPVVEPLAGGGAGGAAAAKVAVAALVAGGIAGGAALEHRGGDRATPNESAQARESPNDTGANATAALGAGASAGGSDGTGTSGRSGRSSGPGGGDDGSSGPGSGSSSDSSGPGSPGSSGPGGGGGEASDGSGSSGSDADASGPDSSGSGSSGSGSSGSGSSGSGSSGSGSGGSGSSGSGSSGSELSSGSSGSGSAGSISTGPSESESSSGSSGGGSGSVLSDSSGSGSSGSGSGDSGED